jgi:hypothetical protein
MRVCKLTADLVFWMYDLLSGLRGMKEKEKEY